MATANAQHNLDLTSNAFQKCAPNIATNIRTCGTVTACNAIPMNTNNLVTSYTSGGDYLLMESLLHHDMEIKMCEARQNGLYDFFMANKVGISHKINSRKLNSGEIEIEPFILARQYSQINNAYWVVSSGVANGSNWQVNVVSSTNIPPDGRSFPPGERAYIDGITVGGTNTHTAWIIVSSTVINNAYVILILQPANAGSYLAAAALTSPTTGILRRGTANVNDYESFCAEPPAYLNWKDVPFWVETQRTSRCRSELYDKWRKLLLEDNALFREFGDLPEIEKNRQLGADWQRRMVDTMMWGKAINANQTVTLYNNLPQIDTFPGGNLNTGGAQCIGKRANMVGIYEQHQQCGRVMDLLGANLDLIALFNSLYQMKRVREASGKNEVTQFDIFTDNITAEAINTAMVAYYNAKSGNSLRLTYDVSANANGNPMAVDAMSAGNQAVHKANFGFNFRSYNIFYPNVRINICSHYFFDDYLSAMQTALGTSNNSGRLLWVLDFAGIYPGILESNEVVNTTGDLKIMAAIDAGFGCTMKVPKTTQTLMSVTGTMIVECTMGNLLIENFPVTGIVSVDANPPLYPPTTTSTTTTTTAATIFYNTSQSYTASCGVGFEGTPVTVTSAANSYVSGISQADANAKALSAATEAAQSQLVCTPIQS